MSHDITHHTAVTSTWHAVNVKNRGSAWLNRPALVSPPDEAHLEGLTAKSNSVVCSNPRFAPRFLSPSSSHTFHAKTEILTHRKEFLVHRSPG